MSQGTKIDLKKYANDLIADTDSRTSVVTRREKTFCAIRAICARVEEETIQRCQNPLESRWVTRLYAIPTKRANPNEPI